MIRAVITIGSNSTRMLCASVLDGEVTVIGRGREETRLFLGLDEEGRLTPEAMTGCVRAVRSLTDEARDEGAQGPVRVYATSATRDAVNQAEFLALLRDAGCPARVLSGKEEASLAFRAAADGDDALVTDIGGGSTELVRGRDGSISRSVSLQLGASRLYRVSPIDSLSSLDRIRNVSPCPSLSSGRPWKGSASCRKRRGSVSRASPPPGSGTFPTGWPSWSRSASWGILIMSLSERRPTWTR